jgi:hypothetical protein
MQLVRGVESIRLHTKRVIAFQWTLADLLLTARYCPDSKALTSTAVAGYRIGHSGSTVLASSACSNKSRLYVSATTS